MKILPRTAARKENYCHSALAKKLFILTNFQSSYTFYKRRLGVKPMANYDGWSYE